MSKITLATVKSFIKKNDGKLFLNVGSRFSGLTDMIENVEDSAFEPVVKTDKNLSNTQGIQGAWFVGSSRDSFNTYDDGNFQGFTVYNCCGGFTIATKKGA